MAKSGDVLHMLCPNIQWVTRSNNYEEIDWLGAEPAITKKQFTDGFAKYDVWKTEQDSDRAIAKSALLERLGITADEARLLLA